MGWDGRGLFLAAKTVSEPEWLMTKRPPNMVNFFLRFRRWLVGRFFEPRHFCSNLIKRSLSLKSIRFLMTTTGNDERFLVPTHGGDWRGGLSPRSVVKYSSQSQVCATDGRTDDGLTIGAVIGISNSGKGGRGLHS